MPDTRVLLELSRDEAREVYDLVTAKRMNVESAEEATQQGMGSHRYKAVADRLWEQIRP